MSRTCAGPNICIQVIHITKEDPHIRKSRSFHARSRSYDLLKMVLINDYIDELFVWKNNSTTPTFVTSQCMRERKV